MQRIAWRLGALAVSTLGATVALAAGATLVFAPERYNDTYSGIETELAPIVRGPLIVRLSSPRYELTVLANRLELERAADCRHRAVLWGRFRGEGELIAEVELGGFPARFEDQVWVPEQEKEVQALVSLAVVSNGYAVTLVDLPPAVRVRIESDLANSLVSFCRRLSLFVAGDAGCGALDHALSNPRLSLPEPGTRFLVRRDELTPPERRQLESYLEGAGDCPPPAAEPPSAG